MFLDETICKPESMSRSLQVAKSRPKQTKTVNKKSSKPVKTPAGRGIPAQNPKSISKSQSKGTPGLSTALGSTPSSLGANENSVTHCPIQEEKASLTL